MIFGDMAIMAALLVAGQAQSGAATEVASPGAGLKEISKDEAETLVRECGARRFGTSVEAPVDGKIRRIRVRLCAPDSDTTAQWIAKLDKAASQIDGQSTLVESAKAKLLGDIRAEIARVKAEQLPALSGPAAITPSPAPLAPINALPPLPQAPIARSAPPGPAGVRLAGPKLAVECVTVGDDRTGRCGVIFPNERLVIRATERFDGAVSLRFRRTDYSITAEVPFAPNGVRAGHTAHVRIPKEICARGYRAIFEIDVVAPSANGGQGGERLGPFTARCGS